MDGMLRKPHTQHVLTYLDPPESTPQSPSANQREQRATWPMIKEPRGFHDFPTRETPEPSTPDRDPLDPSIDLEETRVRSIRPVNRDRGIMFRHNTWGDDRARVAEVLEGVFKGSQRYWAFMDCGSRPVVFQHPEDPDRYKIGCQRCHDRFCLPCSQDRARLIVANLKEQIPYERTRFLTLTLKHSNEPLRSQLDRLYKSFSDLRRRAFWKATVTGGVAFLEVKLGKTSGKWHPHLHVLVRGKYIPQKVLSDQWLQITGDSHIVDIRLATDPNAVYSYLAAYVTKGWGRGIYRDIDRLREAMDAVKGRKLLTCFGSFAKLNLLKKPDPEAWTELGTLHEVMEMARRGQAWAIAACAAINSPSYAPPVEPCPPDE